MSLLSDLFNGNFSNEWMPFTRAGKKATDYVIECQTRVKAQMIDQEIAGDLLLKLELAYGKSESIRSEESFEFGFFFGVHLMMEIFQQDMI